MHNIAISKVDPYLKASLDRFIQSDPKIENYDAANKASMIIVDAAGGSNFLWYAFVHLAFAAAQYKQENDLLKEQAAKTSALRPS